MKIAIVYNRDQRNVINLFGVPNREIIGQKTIKRLSDALKKGKHQVKALEGDKDLIDHLEEFMPRVLKGERPGLVFNVSYGIQGQARYTHVPSILEMIGIPYVGSGPQAHTLALDKVVAKMIFRQQGLPTPDFAVLNSWDFELPELTYPLIVKPKNEAVSFGLKIVHNEEELRAAAKVIFDEYQQPVLVEQYIAGREINVGLIGNNPPEAFPPVELKFPADGPAVYTYEDKTHRSGRRIEFECPASISEELSARAVQIARGAFQSLGCYDCARVDMRMDTKGKLYILEVNSLPSLGEHGSYLIGAARIGLDFAAVINRLVDEAAARYFGTPKPVKIDLKNADSGELMLSFLSKRRDQIEKRIEEWTRLHSRTSDPIGLLEGVNKLTDSFGGIGMQKVSEFTDEHAVWTWQTRAGFKKGTLLIGHLDIPLSREIPYQEFRRDPEWLFGEGIGLSRAPLVMLEFALRGLRHIRRLQRLPIGVLYYTDEGRDGKYSAEIIRKAAAQAKQVFVLRPGNTDNKIITQRRGQRKYQLLIKAEPRRLGKVLKQPDALNWFCRKLHDLSKLSSRKERVAVAATDIHTNAFPMLLPHRVQATLLLSYSDQTQADSLERQMREILGKDSIHWELEIISDRPAMKARPKNRQLAKILSQVAEHWEIPLKQESSLWPSIAGLVPTSTAVVCGLGPVACQLYTPQEAVQRISILQRTLLLAEFLVQELEGLPAYEKTSS
ncbi:MAG: ATP-grasp domain-containing protein [Sedimentisphaerales bacterium]|nr:ATP-grasp domain-containing protein [Sedimentisphaerales bacterium]